MALSSPRPLGRAFRAWTTSVAAASLVLGGTVLAGQADAIPLLSVTPSTTTTVDPGTTTVLQGLSVAGAGGGSDLLATVSTDVGTLAVTATTGLTLAYGNSWTGDTSVTFNGTPDDVNAGLASVALTQAATSGTEATVSLTVRPNDSSRVYAAPNKHFYEFVDAPDISWDAARTAAQGRSYLGQPGYLASIPSAEINDLVTHKLDGAINVWIGASSDNNYYATPSRVWKWAEGPLAGTVISNCGNWSGACNFAPASTAFQSWSANEPNNSGGSYDWLFDEVYLGEWVAVTNWVSATGTWNDWPATLSAGNIDGYVVEYGDRPNGATSFAGLAQASSVVTVSSAPTTTTTTTSSSTTTTTTTTTVPPTTTTTTTVAPSTTTTTTVPPSTTTTTTSTPAALGAPRNLTVKPGDRVLNVSFQPPAHNGGTAIRRYQISLDGGKTWRTLPVTGSSTLRGKVEGVLNGRTYTVKVRALNTAGAGPAARVTAATKQWFHDPLTSAQRSRLIAVPANPAAYSGKVRTTKAAWRSHSGAPAMTASSLRGRELQAGQAVSFTGAALFKHNSPTLTTTGLATVKQAAESFTYTKAIVCEGYADFGGSVSHEVDLSRARAQAVCKALKAAGASVSSATKAYGPWYPVVVGGDSSDRAANRRVVVVVKR